MSAQPTEIVAPTSDSALPIDAGVCASQDSGATPEGAFIHATVLRSGTPGCTAGVCIANYADCFDILRFKAVFSDGSNNRPSGKTAFVPAQSYVIALNKTVYDRRGGKRGIDVGG